MTVRYLTAEDAITFNSGDIVEFSYTFPSINSSSGYHTPVYTWATPNVVVRPTEYSKELKTKGV